MRIRKKILIKGIVQGVSYRKQTARVASELNVKGWVRNRTDGNVEACFEGDTSAVDAMLAWCFFGTERARVEEVTIRHGRYRGRFRDFQIKIDRHVG
jgi:acylphosphatase